MTASTYSCADLEQVAGELGLGVLGGFERAAALAHLGGCPRCRTLVRDMVRVGDVLLELGPNAQPPVGFETRVVGRHGAARPQRARWGRQRWAAVGSGIGVAAMAAGLFIGLGLSSGPALQVRQPGTFAALGAKGITAASLLSDHGRVGQAYLFAGHPSWVFMTVSVSAPVQTVTCQLVTANGKHVDVGSFSVSGRYGSSWGSTVNVDPATVHGIRLVGPDGRVLSHAVF